MLDMGLGVFSQNSLFSLPFAIADDDSIEKSYLWFGEEGEEFGLK